ncbi:MAG: LysR substrate-binding domain-containing protein [Salinisphaera sp.]|jgi:DNA-binding transcriptional LysR family regulator|nr:LysR substrate-binding domain-containing protein [Salinisphaera sp.]
MRDDSATMSFSFQQLRYFVAVAEIRSITGAARELVVSQSTITEAIKTLEADLGVQLVRRHARGMALSHRGHTFLRHAQRILAEVGLARSAFTAGPRITGRLNLGVTSLVAGYALPELLARYRRAFPGTAVSVHEDRPEYLEHYLLNGELDVVLMFLSAMREPSAFNAEVIETCGFRLWVPVGHRLAEEGLVSRRRLLDERYILLDVDEIHAATDALWQGASGYRDPQVAFRTTTVEAVRSLVATGAGVSVLPDLLYRPWSLEGDQIGVVELASPLPPVKVGLVSRRGIALSDTAAAFIDVALEKPSMRSI